MLVTAHSGCDGRPDNAMEYIEYALTLQTDALEVDVWSSDGELVLSHDRPDAGPHPHLRSVFEKVRRHPFMMVNCDLKEKGIEEKVYRAAAETGMSERILFSGDVRLDLAGVLPEMTDRVFINAENLMPGIYRSGSEFSEEAGREMLAACRYCGFSVINVNFRYVTGTFIRQAAAAAVGVSLWTVTEEADIRRALKMHPFNITSRAPGQVLDQVRIYLQEGKECLNI